MVNQLAPQESDPKKKRINPSLEAPSVEITEDTKFKDFEVANVAQITDLEGVKKYPGETISLPKELADYYANLGYIKVDIEYEESRLDTVLSDLASKDQENDELRAELAKLKAKLESTEDSAPKKSVEPSDDSGGGQSASGSNEVEDTSAKRSNAGRKRANTL